MFILPETIKRKLYSTKGWKYTVILNTKLEDYEAIKEFEKEEHLPNYLIVNMETGAIEFAVDQLPAAIQVADKLENELVALMSGFDASDLEDEVRKVQ